MNQYKLINPQCLYCSEDFVNNSNNILNNMGFISFIIDKNDIYEGLYRVYPKLTFINDKNNYHYPLNNINKDSNSLIIWTDCGRTSAVIVGSPSSVKTDYSIIENNKGEKNYISLNKSIKNRLNEGQLLASSTLLEYKNEIEKYHKEIQEKKKQKEQKLKNISSINKQNNFLSAIKQFDQSQLQPQETIIRSIPQVELAEQKHITNEDNTLEVLWKQYADIFLYDNTHILFKQLHINQYIKPCVGNSLVVMPCTQCKQWQRSVPPPELYSPNFHWAPVCFVSSSNPIKYITLESFSTLHKGGTENDYNNLWEFREYTIDNNDSYHSRAHLSEGYGNITISLLITKK